jgi:hypothetical protein
VSAERHDDAFVPAPPKRICVAMPATRNRSEIMSNERSDYHRRQGEPRDVYAQPLGLEGRDRDREAREFLARIPKPTLKLAPAVALMGSSWDNVARYRSR